MPDQMPDKTRGGHDGSQEHSFVPDLAWGVVGGIVVLAVSVLLLTLFVTSGGGQGGTPIPGRGGSPITMYVSELTGLFMAGFLVILIARSVSVRTR